MLNQHAFLNGDKICKKLYVRQTRKGRCLELLVGASSIYDGVGRGNGVGRGLGVELEVCQNIPSGSIALIAAHPAGSNGGVTESNLSKRKHPARG